MAAKYLSEDQILDILDRNSEISDISDSSDIETASGTLTQVVEYECNTAIMDTSFTEETQSSKSQQSRKSVRKAGPLQTWKKGQIPEKPFIGPLNLYNIQVSDRLLPYKLITLIVPFYIFLLLLQF